VKSETIVDVTAPFHSLLQVNCIGGDFVISEYKGGVCLTFNCLHNQNTKVNELLYDTLFVCWGSWLINVIYQPWERWHHITQWILFSGDRLVQLQV